MRGIKMEKHIVRGTPYFPEVSNNINTYPPLQGNISTEVVIVGGGITGALCAYYFAKHSIKTTLIEKSKISLGSTSITTSLLQYELDELIQDLEKNFDLSHIIKGYKFGEKCLNELDNLINELKIDCDYRIRDCLLYTNDKSKINKLKYEYNIRKENGFEVDLIETNSSGFNFSFDIETGVYAYKGGAEINPVKLTRELVKHFVQMGGKVFEDTEIIGYKHMDKHVLLKASNNQNITCKKVIVATGCDISTFTNEKFSTLYTTYNIVTSPIEDLTGWDNRCFIRTTESAFSYLRTTFDNRIIMGGEDTRFIPEVLENVIAEFQYNKLIEKLNKMFPQLNFSVNYKYNGIFGVAKDNLPYIGPDMHNKNIWYCYGANSFLYAVYGAKMLSDLYLGNFDNNFRLVSLNRD